MTENGLVELKEKLDEAIREYKDILFDIKKLKETSAFDLEDIELKVRRMELEEQYLKGKVDAYTEAIIIAKRNYGRNSRTND